MSKVIVDANDPKDGEAFSSGGIRDKSGKLVSQYTNPIPYTEPKAQLVYIENRPRSFGEQHPLASWAFRVIAIETVNAVIPHIPDMVDRAVEWIDDICQEHHNKKMSEQEKNKAEVSAHSQKDNAIHFPSNRRCG